MNLHDHDKPPPDFSPNHQTRQIDSHSPSLVAPESDEGGTTPNSQLDWAFLLEETERFARAEIENYCWRGVWGGVLPGGYDANSIAAEAVVEFLQSGEQPASSVPVHHSACGEGGHPDLQKELKKAARRIVNRLHHRMENEIMHNGADLASVETVDGETVGVLEAFPAPGINPAEELMLKEDAAEFEQFKGRVHQFLGKERLLRQVFNCHCAGISKPKAMARKLKVPVRTIQKLQRRLERRMREFLALKVCV